MYYIQIVQYSVYALLVWLTSMYDYIQFLAILEDDPMDCMQWKVIMAF